jgi:rhodanese-related sulfurtransferase
MDAERKRRYQECQQQVTNYQGHFPDVPTMTSEQLVQKLQAKTEDATNDNIIILVDVRTKQEQTVSMIPGAIPLHKLQIPPCPREDQEMIVYCTVGYRSGREAQRLQEAYPQWKGKVYNLDGILAYSFVEGAPSLVTQSAHNNGTTTTTPTSISTNKIHTYGPTWNFANPNYEAVWFQKTSFVGHLCQTICCSMLRMCQHYGALCCKISSSGIRSKRES